MESLVQDLLESSFMAGVIVYRLKSDIYKIRSELDRLHIADRTYSGLTQYQQDDMDELWKDMEGLIRTYMYYSGDFDLDDLDAWE